MRQSCSQPATPANISPMSPWLRFWAVVGLVKLVRILSLITWYLIPASCSTTMSIKHAIRPVKKPINPHTTQRLISRQWKFWNNRQEKREEREGRQLLQGYLCAVLVNSYTIYHVTHPPLLFQKQLVLDVIIVQTLEEYANTNISLYLDWNFIAKINLHHVNTGNNDFINQHHFPTCIRLLFKVSTHRLKRKLCWWRIESKSEM